MYIYLPDHWHNEDEYYKNAGEADSDNVAEKGITVQEMSQTIQFCGEFQLDLINIDVRGFEL